MKFCLDVDTQSKQMSLLWIYRIVLDLNLTPGFQLQGQIIKEYNTYTVV